MVFLIPIFLTACKDDGVVEPDPVDLPTVSTGLVTQITATNAEGTGEVVDIGGSAVTGRGLCWSTDPLPTLGNHSISGGEGAGSFSCRLSSLKPGSTYHLRSYATNSDGTAYGNTVSFLTLSGEQTVTDVDGNVYRTIAIGNQIWMVENLKVTHFNDGTSIDNVSAGSWAGHFGAAYCDYQDNPSWSAQYGRLYNWAAVVDTKGLAPDGWRVADDADWKLLEMTLGMMSNEANLLNWRGTYEGGKLKEKGITHWVTPNTGATDEAGFTALPGGLRAADGSHSSVNLGGWFWSSTIVTGQETDAWMRWLASDRADIFRHHYPKGSGLSVRCIKRLE